MTIRKTIIMAALVAIPLIGGAGKAQAKDKEYCREYTKTVSINGRAERAYGTACHRPDGSWEIVSLEGSDTARAKVREVMYDDIEKITSRRDRDRVIIVESYHRPVYRSYGTHISYGWPFVGYSRYRNAHHKSHYAKKYYKQKVKHQKQVKSRSNHYGHRYSHENRSASRKDRR